MSSPEPHVVWFEELRRGDVARVGGKNASLGEMIYSPSCSTSKTKPCAG